MKISFRVTGTVLLTESEADQVRASKDKAQLLKTWAHRFQSWASDTPFIEHRERTVGATVAIVDDRPEAKRLLVEA